MTTSSTVMPEFQRDTLLTAAIRLTGVLRVNQSPSPEQMALAAEFLTMEMQTLQATGSILRTVERSTVSLIAGTYEYTLPTDVFDVELGPNDSAGTVVGSDGDAETIVMAMSRGEWMNISAKEATSERPSRVYVEKQSRVKLIFWPIPSSSSYTFKYAKTRYFFANDTGNLNPDISRLWNQYLCNAVASQFAMSSSLPLDRVSFLRQEAERLKTRCENGDRQHGSFRIRVGHSGVNWK